MGTVLLAAGTKGYRRALPHATVHMHPAGGTAQGYAPDVEIQYKELKRVEDLLHELLARTPVSLWSRSRPISTATAL